MKKIFKQIVATAIVLFIGVSSFATFTVTSYSGYYVDRIIFNTTELFLNKNLLKEDSDTFDSWANYQIDANNQQVNGMLPMFPFLYFEDSLLNYCIEKKLITKAQTDEAIYKSKHCGGLTIEESNLLYLHTEILWVLVVNKRITQKEAQKLLDSSRVKD